MSHSIKRPNPYPGPNPFERNDRLYGRDRERRDLLDLLIAERIVLLFSPSGAGKTSLIQAALIPDLEDRKFLVLPPIRVGLERPLGVSGGNRYLLSTLQSLEKNSSSKQQIELSAWTGLSLESYLNQHYAADNYVVFIFDQFEEMLTTDPTDIDAKEAFLREVGQALRNRQRWALFAMREEFIGGLDSYLSLLPTQLGTTFRLDLLDSQAATQAIRYPARDQGVNFDAGAAQAMVRNLSMMQVRLRDGATVWVPGPYVEPVQLQVVCRRLWDELSPDDTQIDEVDVTTVGDMDTALRIYYARSVEDIALATGVSERTIRDWIESKLITTSGIRRQALPDEGDSRLFDSRAIDLLVNAHLIRADRGRGATWFELAHDRLVWPVKFDNESWRLAHLSQLQQRAALWDQGGRPAGLLLQGQELVDAERWTDAHRDEIEPHESDFLKSCQTARSNHRLKLITVVAVAGIILVIALTGLVFYFRAKIETTLSLSRQLAAQSQSHANDQYDLALLLALEAIHIADIENKGGPNWYDWLGARGQMARAVSEANLEARGSVLTLLEHNPNLLGYLKREHTDAVSSVVFNPRDGTLATGSLDGSIRLWQPKASVSDSVLLSDSDTPVTSLVYTLDGDMLAAGYKDGHLTLWSLGAGLPTSRTWAAHINSPVRDLVFSPDGQILTSIDKNEMKLWRVTALEPELIASQSARDGLSEVFALAFQTDHQVLVLGQKGGQIRFWSATEGNLEPAGDIETGLKQIDSLAFSPDGRTLAASGGYDLGKNRTQPRILLYDLENTNLGTADELQTREPSVLTGHYDVIERLAFSPDGALLASGSRDKSIIIWRQTVSGWEGTSLLGHLDRVLSLAFSPICARQTGPDALEIEKGCMYLLASGGADKNIILWNPDPDVRTRIGVRQSLTLRDEIWRMVLIPGCSTRSAGHEPEIERWTESTSENQCEDWLAIGSAEGNVRLRNLATGEERVIFSQPGTSVFSLAVTPDNRYLAAASGDGSVQVWRSGGGGATDFAQFAHIEHSQQGPVTSVAFSPDGETVAIGGSDWKIVLQPLDAAASHAVIIHEPILGWLYSMAFSPDGKHLAAAGGLPDEDTGLLKGVLIIWDLNQNSMVAASKVYTASKALTDVTFSSGSIYVAASSEEGEVLVWELNVEKAHVLAQHGNGSLAVAYGQASSADLLASGNLDNTVILWDVATGQMIGPPLKGHNNSISAVEFSADGSKLVSIDADGVIVIWDVNPASWRDQACRIANRRLTDKEWQRYIGKGLPSDQECGSS